MALFAYLGKFQIVQKALIDYIDDLDSNDLTNLFSVLKQNQITNNKNDFKTFLYIISTISNNHHRHPNFFNKIEQIFQSLQNEIKNNFTKSDLFNIFKDNKRIILFFIKNEFIEVNEEFCINALKQSQIINNYNEYFQPELSIQTTIDDYEEKRQIGENDSYICKLIRQDAVEDFITHVNRYNISMNSQITPSIFETNLFLIQNKPTLIEYAAFFGSIQIFQYLLLNKADITNSIWFYTIHSQNPILIHLIEEINFLTIDSYRPIIDESIKCHHNDITNYLIDKYIKNVDTFNYVIVAVGLQWYNFNFINKNIVDNSFLNYLIQYDYISILEMIITNEAINMDDNSILIIFF